MDYSHYHFLHNEKGGYHSTIFISYQFIPLVGTRSCEDLAPPGRIKLIDGAVVKWWQASVGRCGGQFHAALRYNLYEVAPFGDLRLVVSVFSAGNPSQLCPTSKRSLYSTYKIRSNTVKTTFMLFLLPT